MSDSTPYTKYEQIVSCWASQSVHKKKTAEEIDVMLGQALDTFSHLYVCMFLSARCVLNSFFFCGVCAFVLVVYAFL